MSNQLRYFILSIVFFISVSCSSNGVLSGKEQVKCAKKSKQYKVKNYRVKNNKRGRGVYAYGGGGNSTSPSEPSPEPAPAPEAEEEIVVQQEETVLTEDPVEVEPIEQDVPSIPETKVPTPPVEEEVIEFKGEEITLSEENEFSFDEDIQFIDQSDLFENPGSAKEKLDELSRLLKRNRNVKVTIVGNTATTIPQGDILYGDEPEVLRQVGYLNADTVQIRDVMIARAKRVYGLLMEQGVNSSQMDYTTGSHRMWKKDRVVTFILRKEED